MQKSISSFRATLKKVPRSHLLAFSPPFSSLPSATSSSLLTRIFSQSQFFNFFNPSTQQQSFCHFTKIENLNLFSCHHKFRRIVRRTAFSTLSKTVFERERKIKAFKDKIKWKGGIKRKVREI